MELYITNTTDAQMLAQLRKLNAVMNEAQRQVASGKRVEVSSDAPADVQAIVQNQSDLARVQQSEANLKKLDSEVGMASTLLEGAAKLMDQARTIASQAASSMTNASRVNSWRRRSKTLNRKWRASPIRRMPGGICLPGTWIRRPPIPSISPRRPLCCPTWPPTLRD